MIGSPPDFAFLIHDEERHYVNAHCSFDVSPVSLPGIGRFAGLKSRFKKRAANFVVLTLEQYFTEQRVFLSHLVRLQNNIATSHDEVASEVRRLHERLAAECLRLHDRDALLHELLEQRIEVLERELARATAGRAGTA